MQALNSLNIKILSVFLVDNNGGFKPMNRVFLNQYFAINPQTNAQFATTLTVGGLVIAAIKFLT
jgi:hypothetical protein